MYQFQIYPTGAVSNYHVAVNNVSGVSAILDRRMGIVEHALSGVAYYIANINNYVNTNNVGTSLHPITSGYFTGLGFNNFTVGYTYTTSTSDGIIAPVNQINVSGFISNVKYPIFSNLNAVSGYFYNSVFYQTFTNSNSVTDFVFLKTLSNIFTGLNTADTIAISTLYNSQPSIITDITTYPMLISSSSGILHNISIRSFLNNSNTGYGIVEDLLSVPNFTITTPSINVSGNIYINGLYNLNLSNFNSNIDWFGESLFEMRNHHHNGVNSSLLSFDKFNSSQPNTDPFNLVLTSGNITVNNTYIGNDVGLESQWEIFPINDADIIQRLISYKGRLFILDNKKLIDVENGTKRSSTSDYPRSQVVATKNGDKLLLIDNVMNNNKSLPVGNVTDLALTLFDSDQVTIISFPTNGAVNPFTTIVSRVALPIDEGVRINRNLYLAYIETYAGTASTVFTIYALDTINMSLSIAAHTELSGTDWKFMKPIKDKETIYYLFTKTGSIMACAIVFNIFLKPNKSVKFEIPTTPVSTFYYKNLETSINKTYSCSIFYSRNGFGNVVDGLLAFEYFTDTLGYRTRQDFTIYNNKPIINYTGYGTIGYTLDLISLDRNNFSIFNIYNHNTGSFLSPSITSYAGRLWLGSNLSTAKTTSGKTKTYPYLDSSLINLLGVNTWVIKPIIINGWLYAIANTNDINTWLSSNPATYDYLTNYILPNGSMIVRRRASESELLDMTAYTL